MTVNEMALIQIKPYYEWLNDYLVDLGVIKLKKINKKIVNNHEIKKNTPCTIIEDTDYLKKLDPKNWKEQDHYAVLGIKHVRINANEEDIKRAYRKIVLRHHPDKRGGKKIDSESDYFASIIKAYEILSDPIKRKSFDSVDKYFDDTIPEINNKTKIKFFETFGPVFERNERWSNSKPVPKLGDEHSNRNHVESFYKFWYNFDSWREFSYLDEEDKDKAQDREERRWIEKQNKAERLKKKKIEVSRIRQLVDSAYACDPRIPKFKNEEKEKKLAKKKALEENKKAKIAEEERLRNEVIEKEKLKKEQEELIMNEQKNKERKEKANLKKLIKKEKKSIEQFLESVNYFAVNGKQKFFYLEEFYKRCEKNDLELLKELNQLLTQADDLKIKREAFLKFINRENDEKEFKQLNNDISSQKSKEIVSSIPWSENEIQLLIKAYHLYPVGSQNRWELISSYLKQYSVTDVQRKPKDILNKIREMQKIDPYLKTFLNKGNSNKTFKPVENIFINNNNSHEQTNLNSVININNTKKEETPWSIEEQKLLEQGLKKFNAFTNNRWELIAEQIPTRTKKECIKRYKEVIELIKLKKNQENNVN